MPNRSRMNACAGTGRCEKCPRPEEVQLTRVLVAPCRYESMCPECMRLTGCVQVPDGRGGYEWVTAEMVKLYRQDVVKSES